jgi:hypothetical protein
MTTEPEMFRVGDKVKTAALGEYPDGTVGTVIAIVQPEDPSDMAYWVAFDSTSAEVVLSDYLVATE